MKTKKNISISVIVPIFNSEKYLEKCVRSLLSQSLVGIEFIFVNDGSTDESMNILNKVLREYDKNNNNTFKIINIDTNKGIANARNCGIQIALGNYIGFVDSDDWVDIDMFLKMYTVAKNTNSEIVCCNFVNEYNTFHQIFHQSYSINQEQNLKNLLIGSIFPSLWCEIVKRSLYLDNGICFVPNINMGEDLLVNIKLFLATKNISYIDDALYHYRHTNTSVCAIRSLDSIYNDIKVASLIEREFISRNLEIKYQTEISFRKFFAKLPLWTSDDYRDISKWRNIFPETKKHIFSYDRLDWKMKIEYWLSVNNLVLFAKLFIWMLRFKHRLFKMFR